ncbi:MAG: hypothetical protein WBJ62_05885 [Coriobacteriia bacterium]
MFEQRDLSAIAEVKEIDSAEDVNRYLAAGWLLLSTHLWDYGDPVARHQKTVYSLGWDRAKGDSVHPESSKYEGF